MMGLFLHINETDGLRIKYFLVSLFFRFSANVVHSLIVGRGNGMSPIMAICANFMIFYLNSLQIFCLLFVLLLNF